MGARWYIAGQAAWQWLSIKVFTHYNETAAISKEKTEL
jgi:hypothetical protein